MGRSLLSRCAIAAGLILLGCDPGGGGAGAGDGSVDSATPADGGDVDAFVDDAAPIDGGVPDDDATVDDGGEADAACVPCGPTDECVSFPGCVPGCGAPTYSDPGTVCGEGGTCDGAGTCSAGPITCGDGVRHRGDAEREDCDDGNLLLGDACSPACRPTPFAVAERAGEIDYPPGPRPGVGVNAMDEALYVWTADLRSEPGAEIRFRRFDRAGVPHDALTAWRTLATGLQVGVDPHPVVAGLGSGWVVAWEDPRIDGSALGIAYALVRADGSVGAVRRANVAGLVRQHEPAVAPFAGGFYLAWTDESGLLDGGSASRVIMRRFDAAGAPMGGEVRVETSATAELGEPSVASGADGRAVIAWTDRGSDPTFVRSVRARRYASGVFVDAAPFLVDGTALAEAHTPSVAALDVGEAVVAWITREGDARGDVRARVVYPSGPPLAGSEVLQASANEVPEADVTAVRLTGSDYLVCWEEADFNFNISCNGNPGAVVPPVMVAFSPDPSLSLHAVSATRASDGIWFSFAVDELAPVTGAIRAVYGILLPPD